MSNNIKIPTINLDEIRQLMFLTDKLTEVAIAYKANKFSKDMLPYKIMDALSKRQGQ